MPWPFVSNSGCLFSGLAWMGIMFSIAYAAVSSAAAAVAKNKRFAAAVLSWTMAAVSFLLIASTFSTIADVRHELANNSNVSIGRSFSDAFHYLPEYKYEGFYLDFPATSRVNTWVRELRLTTAIWLASFAVSFCLLLLSLITKNRRDPSARNQKIRPLTVMGIGGLLVVIVHLVSGFVDLSATFR